jgi:peptidoglycan hydrolase-like protein with peptidoglycan-binding domain
VLNSPESFGSNRSNQESTKSLQFKSRSTEYQAGKAAAFMDKCGAFQLNISLYKKFGKSQAYRASELENNEPRAGFTDGIDCDEWAKFANQLLSGQIIAKSKRNDENGVSNTFAKERRLISIQADLLKEQKKVALIKRAKSALLALKHYDGPIDDVAGVVMKTAIRSWQRKNNMVVNEEITETLVKTLERQAVLFIEELMKKRKAEEFRLAEAKKVKNRNAVAVVIGNTSYEDTIPEVKFAENDALAMRDFLIDVLGYRKGNVHVVKNATKGQLERYFGNKDNHKGKLFQLINKRQADVTVFYSGHGIPGMENNRGYLLPVDGDPNNPDLTAYPLNVLLKNLEKLPSKSMNVYLDTCFSGDSGGGTIIKNISGLYVEIKLPKTPEKIVVITAARAKEPANWDVKAKQGLFTKHLLLALKGDADLVKYGGNKDGKITLREVEKYLDNEMTYAAIKINRQQHATISGDPERVLSKYDR